MTKTALENKRIQSNEDIAKKDREVSKISAEGTKARGEAALKAANETAKHNKFNRVMKVVDTGIDAGGKIVGKAAKAFFNDGKWYMQYGPLAAQVANIPLFYPNGQDLQLGPWDSNDHVARVPNVMALHYVNTIGSQVDRNHFNSNPINVTFQRIQAEARANNSRIGEYEPGDLAQVCIAACEVYELLAFAKRAIKVAQTFTADRKNIGDTLLIAMGIANPHSFRNELPQLKETLNILIDKANAALYVPKNWNYLFRKLWLCENIFSDSDVTTSQLYLFVKATLGFYNESQAMIEYTGASPAGAIQSAAALRLNFDSMVTDLMFSSAVTTMLADLRAAYGDPYQMEPLSINDRAQLVYVDEPLMQIENAKLAPIVAKHTVTISGTNCDVVTTDTSYSVVQRTSLTIQQDTNGFLFQGYSSSANGVMCGRSAFFQLGAFLRAGYIAPTNTNPLKGYYFGYHKNDVTAEDIFVSTRFAPTFSRTQFTPADIGSAGTDSYLVRVDSCGTEILDGISMYTAIRYDEMSAPVYGLHYTNYQQYLIRMSGGSAVLETQTERADYTVNTLQNILSVSESFHSRPLLMLIGKYNYSGWNTPQTNPLSMRSQISENPTKVIGDMDKLIPLTWDNLDYIHECADMSLFYIQAAAKRYSR